MSSARASAYPRIPGSWFAALATALLVASALAASSPSPSPAKALATVAAAVSPTAALGRKIFFDTTLSASGRMACATCHDPEHAHGPPNGLAVQLGGPELNRQGARAVPSLRYVLNRTPVWTKVVPMNPIEALTDPDSAPRGGFGWDGRFNTLHEQATFPILSANEMANRNEEEFVNRLQHAAYSREFRTVFGAKIFSKPKDAFALALQAIEHFELEDPVFRPYSSKFDAHLDGTASLSEHERRGMALFDDPTRGNCASCHPDRKGVDGSHPLFTDYQFEALGVPRNPQIRANFNPQTFDQGLCGPLRADQGSHPEYCGLFKTPTLRNVATRKAFFHNGRFHTLRDALRFYVSRDTDSGRWYPHSRTGVVEKFDDLPVPRRANVDVVDLPLTRASGDPPVWNDSEIDDVIAFLETLTDHDCVPQKISR